MRILLIHQAFVSPQEAGGTRHYEFARHCVEKDHQFTVVTSNQNYLSGQLSDYQTDDNKEGVRVLRAYTVPCLHRSFFWRIVAFLSFMVTSLWAGLRAGPIDLVMGTSPPIFQAVSAWLVAAIRRRPFLLEIRDLWPEFAIDMDVLTNPLLIALSRWLESFLYARATHLLVNSPSYRDYLLAKGIPAHKVTLIPNGVDPDSFDPEAQGESLRQELGLNGQFIATYAGALGMANDIPTILRAAGRLQGQQANIHILLVGSGKELPFLEEMAKELQLENVTFAGPKPKSEMGAFLAASDACLATLLDIPMFRTTYPNKVFDYMAAGRPTVLGIDGVIREVVEEAQGGIFVPPGDETNLADTLMYLYENPQQGQNMGRSARRYVERHFHRNSQAEQFVLLVEPLANER